MLLSYVLETIFKSTYFSCEIDLDLWLIKIQMYFSSVGRNEFKCVDFPVFLKHQDQNCKTVLNHPLMLHREFHKVIFGAI